MRALRVLAGAGIPLTEFGVWVRTGMGERAWHPALADLCRRGLAECTGRRGDYRWVITDAGLDLIRGMDERERAE